MRLRGRAETASGLEAAFTRVAPSARAPVTAPRGVAGWAPSADQSLKEEDWTVEGRRALHQSCSLQLLTEMEGPRKRQRCGQSGGSVTGARALPLSKAWRRVLPTRTAWRWVTEGRPREPVATNPR